MTAINKIGSQEGSTFFRSSLRLDLGSFRLNSMHYWILPMFEQSRVGAKKLAMLSITQPWLPCDFPEKSPIG